MECAQMQLRKNPSFRYDPSDPKSRHELDGLLGEFGVSLAEFPSHNFSQLLPNLVWRKTTSARRDDARAALQVFLDLGEGDEILLATIRAGKFSTFSHTELYGRSGAGARQLNA